MSLSTGWTEMQQALKVLRQRWADTEDHWHDPVRQDIDETVVQPLEEQVQTMLRALDRLSEIHTQLKHDCSDRGTSW